jgi:hypothetical protein
MQYGVIEKATGDLLRCGIGVDFENDGSFDPDTEEFRTDVPDNATARGVPHEVTYSRYTATDDWHFVQRIYSYDIDQFPDSQVNTGKLVDEIEGSTDIGTDLISVEEVDEDGTDHAVVITFQTALPVDEEDALGDLISNHDNTPYTPTDVNYYLDSDVEVTDQQSGITGPWSIMQVLIHRRELFNDEDNPVYLEGHTPLLGASGSVQSNTNRIATVETIHGKMGWHNQEVLEAATRRPKDLLIYYGYPNSFNSGDNGWNNENVAQDMAKYKLIVLGDGVQDPDHADYSNTQVIVPRVQALNPDALIFGYVSANQSLSNFQNKCDQWDILGVNGVFIDEAGYDYGKTRSEFNDRVDHVHGNTAANICFANAWNTDHILGTTNDVSYPNSTYNSGEVESNLDTGDWILLESFPINTTAYSGTGGYESKSDWAARGVKMNTLRATYGVNFAGVGIINDDNGSGQDLFDFGFVSALMWSLGAFGIGDTSYGASSAKSKHWTRPDVTKIGKYWALNPSVQVDVGDADVYHRYVELAKLSLDFSSGAQTSSITEF